VSHDPAVGNVYFHELNVNVHKYFGTIIGRMSKVMLGALRQSKLPRRHDRLKTKTIGNSGKIFGRFSFEENEEM
jgi:hypothetical protein